MNLNTKPLTRKPQRHRPLTQTQQMMLGEMRNHITQTMLTGDLTPREAAGVLRRLLIWLEDVDNEPATD